MGDRSGMGRNGNRPDGGCGGLVVRDIRLVRLFGVVFLVLIGRGSASLAQGRVDPPAAPVNPWNGQTPPAHSPPLPAPAPPPPGWGGQPPRPVVPAVAQMPPQAPSNVQNANYQAPVGSPNLADGPVLPASASMPPQPLPSLTTATPAASQGTTAKLAAQPSQQPAVLVE